MNAPDEPAVGTAQAGAGGAGEPPDVVAGGGAFVQPPVGAWPMYRTLVGVGLFCGAAIVSVYLATGPIIAQNRAEALERAVFRVLPAATSSTSFTWADGFTAVEAGGDVHAGFDDAGQLVGVAIPAQGMGYQDIVALLYGYRPDTQTVTGLQILLSRETPGLGDRVETEPAFQAAFSALDVRLAGGALAHPVIPVKPGEADEPGEVDTISGATITSTAVVEIVGGSVATWAPRIQEHVNELQRSAP